MVQPDGDPRIHDEDDVRGPPSPPPPPPPPPPRPPAVAEAYEQHEAAPAEQGYAIPMAPQQPQPVYVQIYNNVAPNPPPPPPPQPQPQPQPLMAPLHQYQQPPPFRPQYPQLWRTGLFDCLDDPENAIVTFCCPCVTFGQVAAAIDHGTSCETSGCIYTLVALVIGLPCIISCTYRSRLRGRFGLVEEPLSDCMTHLCCECCALCQEYRELNHRGINPSAGWMQIGNNQNMNQQQPMNPPPRQDMR